MGIISYSSYQVRTGTTGFEAQALPLCYAVPPNQTNISSPISITDEFFIFFSQGTAWNQIQSSHAQAKALLPIPTNDPEPGGKSPTTRPQPPMIRILIPPNMAPGVILIVPAAVPGPQQAAQHAQGPTPSARVPPVGPTFGTGQEGSDNQGKMFF